jgi:hypothetical protein
VSEGNSGCLVMAVICEMIGLQVMITGDVSLKVKLVMN